MIPALLLLAVGLVMLPRVLEFAGHSWEMLLFPWQIDYDEGVNLNAAWLLSHGANIYKPNTPDHFISALYPPLFYITQCRGDQALGRELMERAAAGADRFHRGRGGAMDMGLRRNKATPGGPGSDVNLVLPRSRLYLEYFL